MNKIVVFNSKFDFGGLHFVGPPKFEMRVSRRGVLNKIEQNVNKIMAFISIPNSRVGGGEMDLFLCFPSLFFAKKKILCCKLLRKLAFGIFSHFSSGIAVGLPIKYSLYFYTD